MVVLVALAVAAGCTTGGIGGSPGFFGLGAGIGGDPGARIPDEPLPDHFVRLGKAPVRNYAGRASVRISRSGRYVGFVSDEAGLTADADEPGTLDVFLLDRATGDTVRVTDGSPQPDLGPDLSVDIELSVPQDSGVMGFRAGAADSAWIHTAEGELCTACRYVPGVGIQKAEPLPLPPGLMPYCGQDVVGDWALYRCEESPGAPVEFYAGPVGGEPTLVLTLPGVGLFDSLRVERRSDNGRYAVIADGPMLGLLGRRFSHLDLQTGQFTDLNIRFSGLNPLIQRLPSVTAATDDGKVVYGYLVMDYRIQYGYLTGGVWVADPATNSTARVPGLGMVVHAWGSSNGRWLVTKEYPDSELGRDHAAEGRPAPPSRFFLTDRLDPTARYELPIWADHTPTDGLDLDYPFPWSGTGFVGNDGSFVLHTSTPLTAGESVDDGYDTYLWDNPNTAP